MNKKLLVIAGPTASGKTAAAVNAALHLKCSVVSADSRQFFREMHIGTARPTAQELGSVPHFFLGNRSIFEDYTVADFQIEALEKISELHQENDWVILTGGSGLYIDAVCNGIDEIPDVSKEIREELAYELETNGLQVLLNELQLRDPDLYSTIDRQNHRRVLRALEVCRATGRPFSELRKGKKADRPFDIIKTALLWDRDTLYERINKRVDVMLESGLIEEARALFPYNHLNALHTVGYSELFRYFSNEISESEAIDLIKQNSRRYAKRQMTWFRRDQEYHWFEADDISSLIRFAEEKAR